jgi:oligosaccharide reducing-end xylanase
MRSASSRLSVLSLAISVAACGSQTDGFATGTGGAGGPGGQTLSGGSPGAGGTSSGGGAPATGGAVATGGVQGNGGVTGEGGSTPLGGGGTGGMLTTGGVVGTGGATGGSAGRGAGGGTSVGSGGRTSIGSGGSTTVGSGGSAGRGSGGSTAVGSGGSAGRGTDGGTSGGAGGSTNADGGSSTVTIPGKGCTPPAAYANLFVSVSGHTQAETDAKLNTAWSTLFNPSGSPIYFNGPGSDESYVKDTYNNDVRTEGMGYGLVIAVQFDKQTEFDRMWTWVRNHMASGCSSSGCTGTQLAWKCSTSGSKLATGGAPDGDEYFAAALVFAHNRWGDTSGKFNYKTEAQWVLNLVRTQDFNKTYNLVKFYSGGDNGQTDASYILPAFYQTWACFDTANADFWNTATTTARAWFAKAADANGMFGDQNAYSGGSPANTGVDKIRVVANIMMDWNFFAADPWQRDTYAPAYAAREKNVGANAEGFCASLLGFGLPASSGKAFVDKLWSAGVPRSYWDGTLYMLALLHVSGTFHLYY